jgi:cytochrome b6-f complex iron-sulfur subunit
MADKKKMSVEDILAACRGEGEAEPPAKGPPATEPVSSAAAGESNEGEAEPQAEETAPSTPVSTRATGGKPAGSMSVADILAAARGVGGAPTAKAKSKVTKPTVGSAAKSASPKPAAIKAAAKPPAKSPGGTTDTSSILAAARQGSKPGPITKSEAAARTPVAKITPVKPVAPPMPSKPAYVVAKSVPVAKSDRRGFFSLLLGSFLAIGFTTLSVTGILWSLGTARFMFPNILIEPPSRFKVGFPSDFAPGTVADHFKAQFGIWIVNTEYNGQLSIVALKTVCTHLGCTPNWLEAEQKFKCPCHGSGFYKDGVNFEGPAPRPLERYAIHVADDGQLEIDKSKTFQQEMGQWSDTASFVPV